MDIRNDRYWPLVRIATTVSVYVLAAQAWVLHKVLPFVLGSAAGYQDRSALLLLFRHCEGTMPAIENAPMGVEGAVDPAAGTEEVITTPPAKRRGGVVSLSMGAAPRTGTTPVSPLGLEVASPRQGRSLLGRSALAGDRKRPAELTTDSIRTMSALPVLADVMAGPIMTRPSWRSRTG